VVCLQVENEYIADLMAKCKVESTRQEQQRRYSNRRGREQAQHMKKPHCDLFNQYVGNEQQAY
jgi:hypothetical protein